VVQALCAIAAVGTAILNAATAAITVILSLLIMVFLLCFMANSYQVDEHEVWAMQVISNANCSNTPFGKIEQSLCPQYPSHFNDLSPRFDALFLTAPEHSGLPRRGPVMPAG